MEVALNLVEDYDLMINPGDARPAFNTEKNILQLNFCCPRCGRKSASAGSHVYNHDTKSISPSIVHDVALGGCGYHGWLINGIFTLV